MSTEQEHGEPERREGLGGRVRRFIDNEVNRAMDKKDRRTDEVDTDRDVPNKAPGIDAHQEPVTVHREPVVSSGEQADYDDQPGRTVPPVTPAPDDSGYASPGYDDSPGYDSASYDSPAHGSIASGSAASDQVSGRSSEETAADNSAERVGLLDDPAGLRDQWQLVQGAFVDDPQRAVHEASVLVDRTLQEIHRNISRGQTTNPASTEDLRVSFQRYREFFQRLLSA